MVFKRVPEERTGNTALDFFLALCYKMLRLVGFNTENQEVNEGLVRFDIVFYVWMKNGLSQIIINVEAQKNEPSEYDILNRAIFYVSRLISSQKERDFKNSGYNDVKQVYSIWMCMNTMNCIVY